MTEPGPSAASSPARAAFRAGFADLVAFMPAHFVWGAVFGAAAVSAAGMSSPEAAVMSLVVWSGTAQLAIVQLMAAHGDSGTTLVAVGLGSLLLSLRFVPMAVALDRRLDGPRWRRALVMLGVVDATFAMAQRHRYTGRHLAAYIAGAWVNAYSTWQVATVAGALFGTLLPAGWAHTAEGVTLVIFAVITAELCTSWRLAACAAAAAALAILGGRWLPEGAAVALAAIVVAAAAAASERAR